MLQNKECEVCKTIFFRKESYRIKYYDDYWNNKRACGQSCAMKIAWKEKDWSKRNKKVALSKKGSRNSAWVGSNVTYKPLHAWIRKYKPKVNNCSCCGKDRKLDLANISKKYKRDINDYIWLCRNCHRKYDLPDFCRNGHEYTKKNIKYHGTRGHRICKKCEKTWSERSKLNYL